MPIMNSPYPTTTIDSVIALLQKAREELGGDHYCQMHNGAGDLIDPSDFDIQAVCRGSACWETMYLVG